MRFARLALLAPLAAGVTGFAFFAWVRDYPFQLAVLMGGAFLFLAFAAVRTWQRLRELKDRE